MKASRFSIERLLRRDLLDLDPYQPIQLPGSVEGDDTSGAIIKLDGNENVYGPSPRVAEALAGLDGYHLYPDPDQRALRRALAGYAGVDISHIIAGAGSDELIDLILRLTLEPGDEVINCTPTFGMYAMSTRVCGGNVVEVPRDEAYGVDVPAVLRAVGPRTKAVFVASPNNPTGTPTPTEDIVRLLDSGVLVVVDEAYYEFSGTTLAGLVPEHENLVVLRTFSKWAGLAGLRVGYGLMAPELVARLFIIKPPYNINVAAEAAVLESLQDLDHLCNTVRSIVEERDRMRERLSGIDYLTPLPSEANFILCHVRGDAQKLQTELRRRGIYVRYFDVPRLKNSVRISVGRPEHTDALLDALQAWGEHTS